MSWNWIDLLLGIILVSSFISGIVRGFSRIAILFAGTITGLVLAAWFYPSAAAAILPFTSSDKLAKFLGFVLIFVAVQLAANAISWMVSRFFKASGLSWLDRLLGGAFGLLRAMLIGTVLVLGLMAFPFRPVASAVAESTIAPYVIGIAQAVAAIAPKEIKDGFDETYNRVKQLWETPGVPPKETL